MKQKVDNYAFTINILFTFRYFLNSQTTIIIDIYEISDVQF